MSNFQCWIIFAAPLFFHQSAAEGDYQDRTRVLLTYNFDTDQCTKLSSDSTFEIVEAANLACRLSFDSLDRLEGNACNGWRHPECRVLDGFPHPQCSCTIAACDDYDIRNKYPIAFRDCAWQISAEEIFDQLAPLPTINFQRAKNQIYLDAMERSYNQRFADSLFNDDPSPSGTHGRRRIECKICGGHYASKRSLNNHIKTHTTKLPCKHCGKTYASRGSLNLHRKRRHLKEYESESVADDSPKSGVTHQDNAGPYICPDCGKVFEWRTSLAGHRQVHTDDLSCQVCNRKCSSKANRKKHMTELHPEVAEAEEAEERARRTMRKTHACDKCNERFVSQRMLREHLPVHRGETTCRKCNITFPRKKGLTIHNKKTHSQPV